MMMLILSPPAKSADLPSDFDDEEIDEEEAFDEEDEKKWGEFFQGKPSNKQQKRVCYASLISQHFLLPFLNLNQHSCHQQAITLSESEDEDSDEGEDGEEGQMLDEIFDAIKDDDDDANEEADDIEVE